MKSNRLIALLVLVGLGSLICIVSSPKAIAETPLETPSLAQTQALSIVNVQLETGPDGVNIILETAEGQTLILPDQAFVQRGTCLLYTSPSPRD